MPKSLLLLCRVTAQQGLPSCPALCSNYCSYYFRDWKKPVSPLSPSRQVSLSVASLRLPTELAPSPAPLGLCRALPTARLCHGSGLAPQGRPRPSPAAGGFLSRSDSLKQSENLRTNEVEASDRLTTFVQSVASSCRGLAARPQSEEGTGELPNVELGCVIKARGANLESC